MIPRSMEHRAQIMEVYLQARLTSLDCLDTDQLSVRETYQGILSEIAKPVSEGVPFPEAANPELWHRPRILSLRRNRSNLNMRLLSLLPCV